MDSTPAPRDKRLTGPAGHALALSRRGADVDAVGTLIELTQEADEEFAHDLVLLFFDSCSDMVAALGSGGADPVKMQVMDAEGNEVAIDDAEPSVRTAVRVLLAEVHGDTEAASDQVDIALQSGSPAELASVLAQALRWTLRLCTECRNRDLPVPGWIAESLAE